MWRPSFVRFSPFLSSVGARFGFDAHYYAKNSALVSLGHVIGLLRGIVTGYLVARLFRPDIYGQYQFMLSIVGMLSIFGLSGLPVALSRAWARGEPFSIRRIVTAQLTVGIVGSVFLIGSIPFLGYYNRTELWPLFLLAGVLFPLPQLGTMLFGAYTFGRSRFDTALKANLAWSIVMVAATFFVLMFTPSALWMLLIVMAVPPLTYLFFLRRIRPPSGDGADKSTSNVIRYAWQLTFATLPTELVWYVDKLLISYFFGLNQLATFAVAILIPEQAKIFLKQFFPISLAKQAQGSDSLERRKKLFRAVLFGTVVFAVGIVLYIVSTPVLIPLLFPQYDSAQVITLTSVMAATLITMPSTLISQYLEAQGMIRENRRANWVAAAVFLVLLVLLIPTYGLLGAILARGGFRLCLIMLSWILLLRRPVQFSPKS